MAFHPNIPLRASDQAEVIQIFLDLMIEADRAGRSSETTSNQPVGPRDDSHDGWFPSDVPDRE